MWARSELINHMFLFPGQHFFVCLWCFMLLCCSHDFCIITSFVFRFSVSLVHCSPPVDPYKRVSFHVQFTATSYKSTIIIILHHNLPHPPAKSCSMPLFVCNQKTRTAKVHSHVCTSDATVFPCRPSVCKQWGLLLSAGNAAQGSGLPARCATQGRHWLCVCITLLAHARLVITGSLC